MNTKQEGPLLLVTNNFCIFGFDSNDQCNRSTKRRHATWLEGAIAPNSSAAVYIRSFLAFIVLLLSELSEFLRN